MTNQEAIEVLKLNNPFMAGKDKENFSKAIDKGIEALENQKTGHWIYNADDAFHYCSECNNSEYFVLNAHYCSNCGAKMEELKGENK